MRYKLIFSFYLVELAIITADTYGDIPGSFKVSFVMIMINDYYYYSERKDPYCT